MKSLEVSEQEVKQSFFIYIQNLQWKLIFQAMQREESYEEQIRDLSTRLKDVSFVL